MDKFFLFLFFTINTLITKYKQTIYSWQKKKIITIIWLKCHKQFPIFSFKICNKKKEMYTDNYNKKMVIAIKETNLTGVSKEIW